MMNRFISDNDIYFMEILDDLIVINDNYCGVIILNNNLEQVNKIELFDDITIYSSFKHSKELLLFCPDNDCFVYLNLYRYAIIPLESFKNCIFSPLYFWDKDNVILIDYQGHLVNVNLIQKRLGFIDENNKIWGKIRKEMKKMEGFWPYKIYEKEKRAIVISDNSRVRLIDYNQSTKVINEFNKEEYHDFEWVNEYLVKISDDKVKVYYNNKDIIDKASKQYIFLKGKIMELDKSKFFFLLYAPRGNLSESRIEKIELI